MQPICRRPGMDAQFVAGATHRLRAKSDLLMVALRYRSAALALVASALTLCCIGASDWSSYRHDLDNSGSVGAKSSATPRLVRRWQYRADSTVTSTPTESNGIIYFGTWLGDVVAVSAADGHALWKAHLHANPDETYGQPRGVLGSVSIVDDTAYAASGGCEAAAYDAMTGRQKWRRSICDNGRHDDVYSSPVVADGLVLIGIDMLADSPTDRGREIALDARTGEKRWSIEPALYKGTGTGISATP